MEDTSAQTLQSACANLNRTAAELGAKSVTVLPNADVQSEDAATVLVHRAHGSAIVFRFASHASAPRRIPETVSAHLDLIVLALQSAREIARLRAELNAANARLATRKIVERAKGLLQAERGITEHSAYAWLRGQSRSRRITLTRIAEEVVRVHGGFGRSQIS